MSEIFAWFIINDGYNFSIRNPQFRRMPNTVDLVGERNKVTSLTTVFKIVLVSLDNVPTLADSN